MKKKHYWKVVRVTDAKEYTSCMVNKGKYMATYKVGEYISAPIITNGLLVFRTRKDARSFMYFNCLNDENMQIFRVKVRGNQILNPIKYYVYDLVRSDRFKHSNNVFPEGTCAFPEVMLVNKSH